jgi:hypothetical protein
MPDDKVITYIEAFYQFVSKPRNIAPGRACGVSHADSFDVGGGRYDYTCRINSLLNRFNTGLRLDKGAIRSAGSRVMSPRLADELPYGGDAHLRALVTRAIEDFGSANPGKRWSGVVHLANAVERVKSILQPSDKAASARQLVSLLSPDSILDASFDAMLKAVTQISNKATVRHHELGKAEIIADGDMIDFLFYEYYNLLRFALVRLDAQILYPQAASAS